MSAEWQAELTPCKGQPQSAHAAAACLSASLQELVRDERRVADRAETGHRSATAGPDRAADPTVARRQGRRLQPLSTEAQERRVCSLLEQAIGSRQHSPSLRANLPCVPRKAREPSGATPAQRVTARRRSGKSGRSLSGAQSDAALQVCTCCMSV